MPKDEVGNIENKLQIRWTFSLQIFTHSAIRGGRAFNMKKQNDSSRFKEKETIERKRKRIIKKKNNNNNNEANDVNKEKIA